MANFCSMPNPVIFAEINFSQMQKLIECVPNFSEGRDPAVIAQITAQIEAVEGVKLLDADPGASTNRTVVTLVGSPEAVVEAAFRAIKKAQELIDMSRHEGAHPRMGATDVCPLIPISGVTDEEAVEWARKLGERVGRELGIPVWLYEKAATAPHRKMLNDIRSGEYEGMFTKIKQAEWKPDFGPMEFPARSGGTVIGVRDFLIAYNVNLNTTSVRKANSVAFDVRENGRVQTENGLPNGKPILGADGEPVRIPGACKAVKGIGWFVKEYGIAQVSMNLTDMHTTPLHIAFEECVKSATARGMRVTGSEIVGLLPLSALTDAGRYFLRKQGRSEGVSEAELVHLAIRSMGLSEVSPFDPQKKIIEYAMRSTPVLAGMTLIQFADELASESPAPGGGSVAALCGALGASLGAMVANLSAGKRGWEDQLDRFSEWAMKGQALKALLLQLVDEDTAAFNRVMDAFGLPKDTDAEKQARSAAIQEANKGAARVPLRVMEAAHSAFDLVKEMAASGNPSSVTDAGVGALCLHTAVMGAGLNVRINLGGIKDADFVKELSDRVNALTQSCAALLAEVMALVESKMK